MIKLLFLLCLSLVLGCGEATRPYSNPEIDTVQAEINRLLLEAVDKGRDVHLECVCIDIAQRASETLKPIRVVAGTAAGEAITPYPCFTVVLANGDTYIFVQVKERDFSAPQPEGLAPKFPIRCRVHPYPADAWRDQKI